MAARFLGFWPEVEAGYIFNRHLWHIQEGQNQQPAMRTHYGLYGAAAARLGFAADRVLFYGKAGVAAAHIRSGAGEWEGDGNEENGGKWGFDGEDAGYGKGTRFGWVAGAGIEWAATDRWSIKGEYLHMNFGSKIYQGAEYGETPFKFRDHVNTFRFGVNHRF